MRPPRHIPAHARAHGGAVADYLNKRGIETESNTRQEDWLFENLLGDKFAGRELKSDWAKKQWLVFRLGIIAAVVAIITAIAPPFLSVVRAFGLQLGQHPARR